MPADERSPGPNRREFWAEVRRDYASLWPGAKRDLHAVREQWRDLIAEIRQSRQFDRRMKQRITGLENPTRRQFRKAAKPIDDELRELKRIERDVLRDHRNSR